MNIGAPYRILETAGDSEVLRVLAGTTGSLSARQVARLVRSGSRPTALRSLNRLAALGVLDAEEVGRSHMFRLNRQHLAVPALEQLLALRERMLATIRDEVEALEPAPRAAGLFGSTARGDGDADSDIDLLLVHEGQEPPELWEERVATLSAALERRIGNQVSVHQIPESRLSEMRKDPPPIARELRRDYLPLIGPPMRELLGA